MRHIIHINKRKIAENNTNNTASINNYAGGNPALIYKIEIEEAINLAKSLLHKLSQVEPINIAAEPQKEIEHYDI